jgi:peptide deformylase
VYIRGSFFPILAAAGMAVLNSSTALFAKHEICILGHKVLKEEAKLITEFGDGLKRVVNGLFEILNVTGNGVGLAAPQVGLPCRIVVIDDPRLAALRKPGMEQKRIEFEKKTAPFYATEAVLYNEKIEDNVKDGEGKFNSSEVVLKNVFDIFPLVLVNPTVSFPSDGKDVSEEGCLSLPGIMANVLRNLEISVAYRDVDEKKHTLKCNGFLAKVVQHEVDHLNGILYVDRLDEQPLLVRGSDPIWKNKSELYKRMQELKDEKLTKDNIPQFEEMLKERFGLKGGKEGTTPEPSEEDEERKKKIKHMLENTFWISKENKGKALEIIKEIGGEDHMLDYDTLLPQSETANNAVEAKSEAK